MRIYIDKKGRRVIEVNDLSYLKERDHRYNWFQRHWRHHRIRISIKKADIVVVPDPETAFDVGRFYFIPKEKIVIRS